MTVPDLDLGEEGLAGEPLISLDRSRNRCPIARTGDNAWAVLGYDEIVSVSRDTASFSSREAWQGVSEQEIAIPLKLDPPEHTKFRRILHDIFRPAAIRAFEERVEQRAKQIIDPVIAAGGGEMVAAATDPFPVMSLCDFIGWPAEDWHEIKEGSLRQNKARLDRDPAAHAAILQEWWAYIRHHLATYRDNPTDNVASQLLALLENGEIAENELLSMMRLLLQAGHGTTSASLGIILHYLATHPDDQAMLRADPALIPAAVEEILRTDGPLFSMPRLATRDVEMHGATIAAGDELALVYLAANRDPGVFEDATTCHFDRRGNRHLLFGTGIHTCVGAPFAKLELRIFIERLLASSRQFRLADRPDAVMRQTLPRNEPRILHLEIEP